MPLDSGCHRAFDAAKPWYLRSLYPLNRWRSLGAFNALMLLLLAGVVALRPEAPLGGVMVILVIANAWLLIGRIISYITVERHLPLHRSAPPEVST